MEVLALSTVVYSPIVDLLFSFWMERPGPKLMTDTQHTTLHTPCIWLRIPEHRMWILPHFKIPHSNIWIWCWSFKCRILRNRHRFRAWAQNLWWILRTLHSGFTLHTQDCPIQIHWVLSVECWVSVISLGPGSSQCRFIQQRRKAIKHEHWMNIHVLVVQTTTASLSIFGESGYHNLQTCKGLDKALSWIVWLGFTYKIFFQLHRYRYKISWYRYKINWKGDGWYSFKYIFWRFLMLWIWICIKSLKYVYRNYFFNKSLKYVYWNYFFNKSQSDLIKKLIERIL